jgi:hypothetical protein
MEALSERFVMALVSRRTVLASAVIAPAIGACTVRPVETDVAVVRFEPPPPRYEVVPGLPP